NSLGGDVTAIAICVRGSNRLLVELRQKDVRDCVMNRLRRMFEEIGEANMQPAFAESNCCVQGSESTKANVEGRNGRARPEVAVLFLKNRYKRGVHCRSRLTCRQVHSPDRLQTWLSKKYHS